MTATGIAGIVTLALNTRLAALTLSPAMTVAWPNSEFTPPAAGYLEPIAFRNLTQPTGFRTNTLQGIYQVSVRKPLPPASIGAAPADNAADAVAAHFPRGLWLPELSGVTVRIRNTSVGTAIKDDPYWMVPVSIEWFAQDNF